jgi:hypothetical protein
MRVRNGYSWPWRAVMHAGNEPFILFSNVGIVLSGSIPRSSLVSRLCFRTLIVVITS